MRRIIVPIVASLLLGATAGALVTRADSDSSPAAAHSQATASPAAAARTGDSSTATPAASTTATASSQPKATATPEATPSPTATPAPAASKRKDDLSGRIPSCGDLLAGATEDARSSLRADQRARHQAEVVTLACGSKPADFTIVVTRFADSDDARFGDELLRRQHPLAPKDRGLDLDGIGADVKGGAIMPDELGGLVFVGFRKGTVTVTVTAQPASYGKHVEGDTGTIARGLAGALG